MDWTHLPLFQAEPGSLLLYRKLELLHEHLFSPTRPDTELVLMSFSGFWVCRCIPGTYPGSAPAHRAYVALAPVPPVATTRAIVPLPHHAYVALAPTGPTMHTWLSMSLVAIKFVQKNKCCTWNRTHTTSNYLTEA